jgi:Uma2 family endonuclease
MVAAVHIHERVRIPASAMDHAGFRAWVLSADLPSGVRATFVAGEVDLEMSPEALDSHNKVKSCFTAVLSQIAASGDLGEVYGDGVLVTHEGAALSSEPDTTFVSWDSFESGRVRLRAKVGGSPNDAIELVGSPDVVVEVVSDSSVRKDTKLLREAYFRADVPEHWIVDARGENLSFEILCRDAEAFVASAPSDRPQRSGVFGATFTLSRTKNRAERWTYGLNRS